MYIHLYILFIVFLLEEEELCYDEICHMGLYFTTDEDNPIFQES